MKFNLNINQEQAIKLGIKNINQAHIFDMLSIASIWANIVELEGQQYYWVARNIICDELPLLDLKSDTVYRHLKHLDKLGLIIYKKQGKKDLIKITELGKKYHSNTMSEINPKHYVGNKSEKNQNSEINPRKLGNKSEKNSEINPTYHTTNNNHTTNNHNKEKYKKEKYKKIDLSNFNEEQKIICKKIIDYRIEIKKPLKTTFGLKGIIKSIKQTAEHHNKSFSEVMQIMFENEWQTIKPEYIQDNKIEVKKGTVEAMTDLDKRMLELKIEEKNKEISKQKGFLL